MIREEGDMEKKIKDTMTLEEYKKAIEQRLLEFNRKEKTEGFMLGYEEDFQDYYNDDWPVNAVATAMEMGL